MQLSINRSIKTNYILCPNHWDGTNRHILPFYTFSDGASSRFGPSLSNTLNAYGRISSELVSFGFNNELKF